jgi:hypothetical protein
MLRHDALKKGPRDAATSGAVATETEVRMHDGIYGWTGSERG